ncbi:MAG: nitroreductase/quinone reductase family protein [Propionibacteriales bacterium]|nr:nitroreductase/quinone reductase family protein [Propionibacteriales bacterium]
MKLSTQAFLTVLKIHQSVYENSRGLIGHRILLMPTLLLRTTGRKTGKIRTNALVYADDAGRYLVCASNGGHDLPPAWLLNLAHHGHVEVQVGVRRFPAVATAVRPDNPDYQRLFALANTANRGQFARYQQKTTRQLPVVVLTPT